MYSYLETTSRIQEEMNIEKAGMFIVQRLQQDIISHKEIIEPVISPDMPISDFSVNYIPINDTSQKVTIYFYIKEHFFTFTHLIDQPYAQ